MNDTGTIELGDIVEIQTAKGRVCVQVTHRHQASAEVVRVMPGFDHSNDDLAALARQETLFVAMTPLSSAMQNGRVAARRIGNFAIPEHARPFPTFRMEIREKLGAREKVAYWWFWDGDGLVYDADPGPEAKRLPMREVLSIDEFVRRLEHQPKD